LKKLSKNGKANLPGGRPTQNCCATKQRIKPKEQNGNALKQKSGFPVISRHYYYYYYYY